MTPALFKKQLDKHTANFSNICDSLLADVRASVVIPFCDKHACGFSAGMGSWSFHGGNLRGGQIGGWNDDELPKRVRDVLQTHYPLNRGQSCGSMMQSYTPANFKD